MSDLPFEGLLLVDKPTGCTSHDVVARIRKLLNTKKVGHAGTLDPLATGLMIVLVGRATRLSDYLLNGDKTYEVEVQLGVETDTLDADGKEVARWLGDIPNFETIQQAVLSTRGELELQVPDYSAAKVKGKKLYEYAREGHEVPKILKKMSFDEVSWISSPSSLNNGDGARFTAKIRCSKGSFIRTWAQEVGRRLGVGGHVLSLRRTESSPYSIHNAVKLGDLEEVGSLKGLSNLSAVPLEKSLNHYPQVNLNSFEEKLMLSGQIPETLFKQFKDSPPHIRVLGSEERLLAILQSDERGSLKIGCVLGIPN